MVSLRPIVVFLRGCMKLNGGGGCTLLHQPRTYYANLHESEEAKKINVSKKLHNSSVFTSSNSLCMIALFLRNSFTSFSSAFITSIYKTWTEINTGNHQSMHRGKCHAQKNRNCIWHGRMSLHAKIPYTQKHRTFWSVYCLYSLKQWRKATQEYCWLKKCRQIENHFDGSEINLRAATCSTKVNRKLQQATTKHLPPRSSDWVHLLNCWSADWTPSPRIPAPYGSPSSSLWLAAEVWQSVNQWTFR